ncbi:hypothetical protein MES4922_10188 [Mesorhizobium ventifaucium]|uniref:Uncharacterized protein n=1 Tax=Mesorhizobium ventifaucium TaxID=666020 RepID=A0ABM9DER2_9HYPH|nr:hypothetical protein MES4922_10188 [Mesorhizobium ventifaucium]
MKPSSISATVRGVAGWTAMATEGHARRCVRGSQVLCECILLKQIDLLPNVFIDKMGSGVED